MEWTLEDGFSEAKGHLQVIRGHPKPHKDQWKNPYYQHQAYFIRNNAIFYRTGIPEPKICFILDSIEILPLENITISG